MSWVRAIVCALLLSSTSAFALVLDWSTVTWTPGSLSQAYDVDNDNIDDVLITIAGDTSTLVSGSPSITTGFQGGLGSPPASLGLFVDFANESQFITVYVTFLGYHAGEISFSLFDVDGDPKGKSSHFTYQDQIRNISVVDGATFTPTVATGSNATYTGSIVTGDEPTVNTGAGSGGANVDIGFQDSTKTLQFTFGSSPDVAGKNVDPQEIGLYNITFKKPVVPEVGVPHIAFLLCFLIVSGRVIARRFSHLLGRHA